MGFDLCQVKRADKPYYIESISTNIYTIEELCFYLYENVCLIDQTIVNEALCDWLRDELGLKKLYRQLYEQLERQDGIAYFVMPIFREIGYLSPERMRQMQERLSKLEVQPEDVRQKLKGDYLVKCGMYGNAMHEYYQILGRKAARANWERSFMRRSGTIWDVLMPDCFSLRMRQTVFSARGSR